MNPFRFLLALGLLALGKKGIAELCAIQQEAILSAEKPADPNALQSLAAMFGKK